MVSRTFKIKAAEGLFGENTAEISLSDISAVWEANVGGALHCKLKRARDGAELQTTLSAEEVFALFEESGIPTIDAVTVDKANRKQYLINLDHAALHKPSEKGSDTATIAVKGFPNRYSSAVLFYALNEQGGRKLTQDAFLTRKLAIIPAQDFPVHQHAIA